MKLWIDENNQRCCDRSTAVELGGQKYANKKITLPGNRTAKERILHHGRDRLQ